MLYSEMLERKISSFDLLVEAAQKRKRKKEREKRFKKTTTATTAKYSLSQNFPFFLFADICFTVVSKM